MKVRKLLASILMLSVMLSIVFAQTVSYATKTDSFFVNLTELRTNSTPNLGYSINNPLSTGGDVIWDLISYSSASSTSSTNKDLYCVKGGAGHTWGTNTSTKVEYKTGYDLKTEKSTIAALSTEDYKNIAGANYNQILWVTDNLYIPGTGDGKSTETDRTALIKAAGIDSTEAYEVAPITDDDIEVVQQMALWYFTNSATEVPEKYRLYHQDSLDNIFVTENSNMYTAMNSYKSGTHEGAARLEQMNLLYDYLIEKNVTQKNSSKYNSSSNELGQPVSVTAGENFKLSNGKIGPIKITKSNDLPYILEFSINGTKVTDANSFVDVNGTVVDKDTFTGDIYVKTSQTSDIEVKIDINYKTTESTLWVPGTSLVEQPVIEVKKVPHNLSVTLNTEKPKPFDLALRKFISGVTSNANGTFSESDYLTGDKSRAPQITGAWRTDEATTLVKNHSKTPLTVKHGNYIEYTIRVYNEGELDGYAEQITDYILQNQGLQFVENHPTNTTYRWSKSGNKLTTDYLSKAQGTGNLLTAYDGNVSNLSYKDVKIVFKVTEQNSSKNTLVNIAEISKAKDKDGNDLNNTGDDRDSTPGTDKENYPDGGYNTENHEDDIDYEPVVLKPFDLALRKFISAISQDATIEESEKLTGTASREPVISGAWRTDEPTTLVKDHSKDPLSVKNGNYVLYTIRVYNEGEVDGYASLIKDNIPEGLEFVTTDATYNGIWTLQSDGSITTDWLAKGKGAEVNSTAGEAAYTANLLKALKKNSDGSVTVSTTDPKNPDYRDVQVLLKVTEPDTSTRTLTNYAQISEATDEDGNPTDDRDSTPDNGYKGEDDDDFEPVILEIFDLSLRKFITAIDGQYLTDTGAADGTYTRGPVVDTTTLTNGTTSTYNHTKNPLEVKKGSTVVYTIRVYNEGTTDGYASQVTDFLPPELEFAQDSSINTANGWSVVEGSNGRKVVTNKLANTVLTARTENTGNPSNPYTLACQSLQIECKVKNDATIVPGQKITNIAEITEYKDKAGTVVRDDIDSKSNSLVDTTTQDSLPTDENLPTYKDDEIASGKAYIPGQQDDDDFEKVIIAKEKYDLALRKFITSVNGKIVDTREPQIGDWGLDKKADADEYTTTAKTHSKAPIAVSTGDTVRFTIRVYNEGNVAGTATEITDYLPEGLEFIEPGTGEGQSKVNLDNGWTGEGKVIKTTKLAGETINPAQETPTELTDTTNSTLGKTILNYKDVEIECKVIATKVNGHNLRNIAAITGDDGDDIDSNPENNPTNNDEYPTTSNPQGKGQEDDDDFEELRMKAVDFALRKFITSVDGKATTGREPTPDVSKLIPNGTEGTAIYNHAKDPLAVKKGSNIIYTIRVYNEGEADGFVGKITDYLPENLEFVENSETNTKYGWKKNENGSYSTEYLAAPKDGVGPQADKSSLIKAFDGTKLDSRDVQIECKVKDSVNVGEKITNIADIARYENENGDIVNPDRDSTSSNVNIPEDLPGYKDDEIQSGKTYIPGQEDDDDFEKVYIPKFDLSLRKFITNINGTEETSRIPQVDATDLVSGKSTTATYNHPKDPVKIAVDDIVTYTIRVYNEGDIDGYAAEIADDLPEHLIFLPQHSINTTYGWKMYDEQGKETTDVSKATQVKTKYLSKQNEKSEGANLLKAFDKTAAVSDTNPDHKEVKIAFQVSATAQAKKVITNYAQITENTDKNEDPVDDIDSTPDKWIDGEDDQDVENLIPQVFDLGLLKYVTQVQVTEDGKTTTTNTNNVGNHSTDIIPKVEIDKKKIGSTTVKFIYTIKVINISDVAGNPQEIIDYIPEGLEFIAKDNPQWKDRGNGTVSTDALVNTRLEPGQSADVKITLEWVNGASNMGLKHNVAQMADKQDYADVLLSIKTGQIQLYILLGASVLLVLAGGIFLIKKYVL